MRERIEAVGSTLARQAVDIVPLTSGRVAEIAFDPGARVETGAVLVRLDDAAERAAVAEAEAGLREAELALDRARSSGPTTPSRRRPWTSSRRPTSAPAPGSTAPRSSSPIVRSWAPFPGVVGLRRVDLGARVDDSTVLTTLDDLAEVEIEFSVPEIFFSQVRQGQAVSATSSAFPGRTFSRADRHDRHPGRPGVARLPGPRGDSQSGPGPAGGHVHARRGGPVRAAGVLIPEEAVIAEGDAHLRVHGAGRAGAAPRRAARPARPPARSRCSKGSRRRARGARRHAAPAGRRRRCACRTRRPTRRRRIDGAPAHDLRLLHQAAGVRRGPQPAAHRARGGLAAAPAGARAARRRFRGHRASPRPTSARRPRSSTPTSPR